MQAEQKKEIYDRLVRWCEALESGKYFQGDGYLRTYRDAYCCLGVACDVLDHDGWTMDKEAYKYAECVYYTGENINKLFGISHDESRRLARMNDRGVSFAEIAQYIREHILPRYALEAT